MLGDATLAYAEAFTAAPLGIDALYRAESADGDGLVVLTMSTTHRPEPFAGHNDARARFTQLRARGVARGGGRAQVCQHRGVGSQTLTATVRTLTLAVLRTIVEEAHDLGVRTMCHAYGGPGLQAALDAGIESIEHGAYLGRTPAPIAQMVEQGTYFVPTFRVLALHRERGAPWAQRKARALHEDHLHAFRLARGLGCASRWGPTRECTGTATTRWSCATASRRG